MISNRLPDSLDALFRPAVEAGHIPGVVMGVTSSDRVLYQGAFGKKSSDGTAELELDAVFNIELAIFAFWPNSSSNEESSLFISL